MLIAGDVVTTDSLLVNLSRDCLRSGELGLVIWSSNSKCGVKFEVRQTDNVVDYQDKFEKIGILN